MQWQRSKNWIYRICILGFLLMPFFLHATDEEKIQRGIKRLNELIEKNAANDARGESYLNEYIFSLEEDPDPGYVIIKPPAFVKDEQLLSDLRKELADLASKGIHFYIALSGALLHVEPIIKDSLNELKYDDLYSKANEIIRGVRAKSNLAGVGGGKNVLVGITPVQVIGLSKSEEKDKLSFVFLRTIASGKGFSDFFQIINNKYKSSFTKYSSSPADALRNDKTIYISVLKNYEEEKKALLPGSSPPSLQFIEYYKQYATNSEIKAKIGEITRLIDKDQNAYLEMRELMKGDSILKLSHPGGSYRFFNQNFDVIDELGSTSDAFEAFKQSIITYQNYKKNLIALADEINCDPKPNETANQFKARVYYTAALLTPATSTELSLSTREKLLCALSKMSLMGLNTIGRDQLTTSEAKEEAVLLILNTTPQNQRKELINYLSVTSDSSDPNFSVFSKLAFRIDSQNYQDFILRMIDWLQVSHPSTETWDQITQRAEREHRAILPLGATTDQYEQALSYEGGKTVISYKIYKKLGFGVHADLSGIGITEEVVVKFTSAYEIGGKKFEEGELRQMPALLAYLIMHNMKIAAAKTVGKYTLYAAGFLIGASEIAAAETGIELTIAIIDMTIASSDFAINEVFVEKISKVDSGGVWLKRWNQFVLIYSAGRIVSELTGISNSLKSLSNKINKPEVEDITRKIIEKMDAGVISTTAKFKNFSNINKLPEEVILKLGEKDWPIDVFTKLDIDLTDDVFKTKFLENGAFVDSWYVISHLSENVRKNPTYLRLISEDDKFRDIVMLYKNKKRIKIYDSEVDEALVYHYSKYSSEARAKPKDFYDIYKTQIDEVLENLPASLNNSDEVYGGYTFSEEIVSQFSDGNFVAFNDLLSTSKSKIVAETFLKTKGGNTYITMIDSYNGKFIKTLSAYGPEEEVLFGAMSVFKVKGTPKRIPHPNGKPGETVLAVFLEQQ